jgi:hypothetical protein
MQSIQFFKPQKNDVASINVELTKEELEPSITLLDDPYSTWKVIYEGGKKLSTANKVLIVDQKNNTPIISIDLTQPVKISMSKGDIKIRQSAQQLVDYLTQPPPDETDDCFFGPLEDIPSKEKPAESKKEPFKPKLCVLITHFLEALSNKDDERKKLFPTVQLTETSNLRPTKSTKIKNKTSRCCSFGF